MSAAMIWIRRRHACHYKNSLLPFYQRGCFAVECGVIRLARLQIKFVDHDLHQRNHAGVCRCSSALPLFLLAVLTESALSHALITNRRSQSGFKGEAPEWAEAATGEWILVWE